MGERVVTILFLKFAASHYVKTQNKNGKPGPKACSFDKGGRGTSYNIGLSVGICKYKLDYI